MQRIDERLSALGNCIACNDYVALIHPDVDKVIKKVLLLVLSPHADHAAQYGRHPLHD